MVRNIKLIPIYLKERIAEIPRPILKFGLKCLIIFIVWQSIYVIFLEPKRIIDKPLTELVGNLTSSGLKIIYPKNNFRTSIITSINKSDINIYRNYMLYLWAIKNLLV